MVTAKEIEIMLRNDLSLDVMGDPDDSSDNTEELVDNAIKIAEGDVAILSNIIPPDTKDSYVRVIAITYLLDRMGVEHSAFQGYYDNVKFIRGMISKVMLEKSVKSGGRTVKSVLKTINYGPSIITNDFIDGFDS